MAAGGVFKLIANDGKADRMIMATELLNQRIKDIMCMRARENLADPTPTLVDIERTHILFVNAHFKPFAAIGYEYNKVKVNQGATNWGDEVTFSIPQFGDFFHDMVVNVLLEQVQATAGEVPTLPTQIGTVSLTNGVGYDYANPTANGASVVVHKFTYTYVNQNGTVVLPGDSASNFIRYAEFPGERLFYNVKFDVNGNPLDEYNSDVTMMYRKFRVAPGKLTGWKRLVGQEVPKECYSDLNTISGTTPFPVCCSNFTETGLPTGVSNVVAVNKDVTSRRLTTVVDGAQTPKAIQPALDLWIPLLFWFNRDARLSIPSVSIPYGQRFITIKLEAQNNIVFTSAGNLWLKLEVECYIQDTGTLLATTYFADPNHDVGQNEAIIDVERYNKCLTMVPVLCLNSTVPTSQQISRMELYINNIFVNPEIHDIYIKRIGFSLIRVHRFQRNEMSAKEGEQLLSSLKWPIETLYVGFRPRYNTDSSNLNQWRDWHNLTRLLDKTSENVCRTQTPFIRGFDADHDEHAADAVTLTNAVLTITPDDIAHATCTSTCDRGTYTHRIKTVDRLTLNAHGITLFGDFPDEFFNEYMPWQYGGYNIVTPDDEGALMINFCLYPGTYQPSGHINVSRAREFYIKYTSSYIGSDANSVDPVQANPHAFMIVVAIAINFLLISDGSAVLRYST